MGELEAADALIVVLTGGVHGAHEYGEAVATKGVLQKAGELRVAVRHVHAGGVRRVAGLARRSRGGGRQRQDHLAKCGEARVDVLRLLGTIPLALGLLQILAACKVHEVKAPGAAVVHARHVEREDGVRARRYVVECRGCSLAQSQAASDQRVHRLQRRHLHLPQPLHGDVAVGIFRELQVGARILLLPSGWREVANLVQIKLAEGHLAY
mmetsp:Transcript_31885/g.80189  ORF Transcript_31885/g.80189 Transcript_31885/m.80189 type:complete len:210 (-) Transcript_31885:222-851(-)